MVLEAHGARGEGLDGAAAEARVGEVRAALEEGAPGVERGVVLDFVDEVGLGWVVVEVGEVFDEAVGVEEFGRGVAAIPDGVLASAEEEVEGGGGFAFEILHKIRDVGGVVDDGGQVDVVGHDHDVGEGDGVEGDRARQGASDDRLGDGVCWKRQPFLGAESDRDRGVVDKVLADLRHRSSR